MGRRRRAPLLSLSLCLALAPGLLGIAPPDAQSDAASPPPAERPRRSPMAEYDPQRAGHPLRMVAYVLHPVGVIVDVLVLRPAYWIGSHEPLRTLFGRED